MSCLQKFLALKSIIKYSIIIGSSLVLIALIVILIIAFSGEKGKNKGAYLKTPDASILEYRLGNGIGGFESSWSIDNVRNLMAYAGYDGMRKKLPEAHLSYWGYGIELGVCEINQKHGILDVIGYLCTPSKSHSSNTSDNNELCYPDHLYEPIWLESGEVNPNNYWAYYVNKTVTTYKDYIKIWETWNEPDYTRTADTGKWENSPPDPKDLTSWHGTIFQYIRLLRITYEVAKKVDPECWVATGGLGYPYFLDAIMRYTDNPENGEVTKDYPAYGGAYFDCDAYHKYPQWGSYDMQTGESIDDNGSDSHAKKVVTLKKNHHYIIKKYGFGDKYPDKLFVNTETGLRSAEMDNHLGGDLVRRNWIIKLALLCIEYDVRQLHILNLEDSNGGYGDYDNIGKYVSLEEGYTHLKSSSKGRATLKKMNLGKYVFDEKKTTKFRESLPANVTGIVLKRKFPKVENEEFYYEYMYSVWLLCIKEEVQGEMEIELDIPFDPLKVDWEGNKEQLESDSKFKISSTPIFLLGNEGLSGLAIFFIILGSLIVLLLLGIVILYCYKKFIKKQDIPFDKNLMKSLLK